jgi:hypothetical protein
MGKDLAVDLSSTHVGFYDGALNLELANPAMSGGAR